ASKPKPAPASAPAPAPAAAKPVAKPAAAPPSRPASNSDDATPPPTRNPLLARKNEEPEEDLEAGEPTGRRPQLQAAAVEVSDSLLGDDEEGNGAEDATNARSPYPARPTRAPVAAAAARPAGAPRPAGLP